MYRHILIPTDGSELAERAVTHGLSLAKFVGAKITVLIVEERVGTVWSTTIAEHRLAEVTAKYADEIKKHATTVLDHVAKAAKQAGVPCDRVQVEDVQPYEAIIATATDRGLRSHRHGIARMQRTIRSCAGQCHKQGTDVHESSDVGYSARIEQKVSASPQKPTCRSEAPAALTRSRRGHVCWAGFDRTGGFL